MSQIPTKHDPSRAVRNPPIDAAKTRSAFARYRVLAWITGTMLLLLCAEMLLKYVLHAGGVASDGSPEPVIGSWVAFAHGWVYVVYLVTAFDLWSKVRWPLSRMLVLVIAGVVPGLSFVMEHRARRWVAAELGETDVRPTRTVASDAGSDPAHS